MADLRFEFPLLGLDGSLPFRFLAGLLLFDGPDAFLLGDAHRLLAVEQRLRPFRQFLFREERFVVVGLEVRERVQDEVGALLREGLQLPVDGVEVDGRDVLQVRHVVRVDLAEPEIEHVQDVVHLVPSPEAGDEVLVADHGQAAGVERVREVDLRMEQVPEPFVRTDVVDDLVVGALRDVRVVRVLTEFDEFQAVFLRVVRRELHEFIVLVHREIDDDEVFFRHVVRLLREVFIEVLAHQEDGVAEDRHFLVEEFLEVLLEAGLPDRDEVEVSDAFEEHLLPFGVVFLRAAARGVGDLLFPVHAFRRQGIALVEAVDRVVLPDDVGHAQVAVEPRILLIEELRVVALVSLDIVGVDELLELVEAHFAVFIEERPAAQIFGVFFEVLAGTLCPPEERFAHGDIGTAVVDRLVVDDGAVIPVFLQKLLEHIGMERRCRVQHFGMTVDGYDPKFHGPSPFLFV